MNDGCGVDALSNDARIHAVDNSLVFRAKDAEVVRVMYQLVIEVREDCCPKAAVILETAEPNALANSIIRISAGSACAQTTCGSARTGRQGAGQRWCRFSVRILKRLDGAVMCDQDDNR